MIKIMSFNIRYGSANDGANHWEKRKDLVIQRILQFNPHLVGIQECRDDEQAQYLQNQLSEYAFLGVRRGGTESDDIEMAPLLYKKSFFQLMESNTFWLSNTPHVPGSKSWKSQLPRTATWIKLHRIAAAASTSLLFINTHFDHSSPEAKEKSALLLRNFVNQPNNDMPIILTGDFNTTKDTSPYKILATNITGGNRLKDVSRDTGPSNPTDEGTLHSFGGIKDLPSIDWILTSEHIRTLQVGIDKFHIGGIYPSDHYPVFAAVELISN